MKKGSHVQIPTTATKYVLLKKGERPEDRLAKASNGSKQTVQHQMKSGETLDKIAKQYQVPLKSIMQWNKISDLRKVKNGQKIAIHIDRPAPDVISVTKIAKTTVAKETTDVPSLEATKKRSITSFQPLPPAPGKAKQQTLYVVKNGDSVVNIAKKFQITAQDLRQWNKLSNNTLQTGNKLIVKNEG